MLIVALGVLTLLSLLAVTFVTLMRLEKNSATNYVDGVKAKMAAEAGLQRIVADMKTVAKEPPFDASGKLAKFIYGALPNGKEVDVSLPVENISPNNPSQAYFYGRIGASYRGEGGGDFYRVKVIDTSGLLDLNFPMERDLGTAGTGKPIKGQVLERMFEALGTAIAIRTGSGPSWDPVSGQDPKAKRPAIRFGGFSGASAILAYRMTLDGMRFNSKTQLQEIMEEASYKLLSDYVTAHGATEEISVAPSTSPGQGGHSAVKRLLEPRAMVNVNTAPKEVLIAAIAPLVGRRHVYHLTPAAVYTDRSVAMEEKSEQIVKDNYLKGDPDGDPTTAVFRENQREDMAYDVREGWIYVGPFGVKNADEIAKWIIQKRPFNGYADFYQKVMAEMLKTHQATPSPGALDAFVPPTTLQGKTADLNLPGVRYFTPTQPDQERFDITGIESQPYFASLVRDAGYAILLANFNPGFVANSAVPNSASYLCVDKGNLLLPDEAQVQAGRDGVLFSRQTMEFCYDTKGVFEVTSLGQIKKAFGEIVAQEKVLTVVKLLGQMTHRTQYDFERNDQLYTSGAAGNPRTTFTTFPNPRRLFATLTAPVDDPDTVLASSTWGHLEVDVRSVYEDNPGGAEQRFRQSFAKAGFGTALFGSLFEWHEKGLGVPQEMAIHAFIGDRQRLDTRADLPSRPFNKARGSLPGMPTRTTWTVANGNCTLYNDGTQVSYRMDRDNTLWHRAGASTDDDTNQGALPMNPDPSFTGAPGEGVNGDHKQGNVWYRKGGFEFWYKPDFDWCYSDAGTLKPFPVYCGYVSASRVYYNPGVPAQTYGNLTVDASIKGLNGDARGTPTDGTQLYVFRNTEGQIRATRLFFRVVGKPDMSDKLLSERPSRFLDPDETDTYGNEAHAEYPGAKSFIPGPLEPGDAKEGGAVEVFRRAAERKKYIVKTDGTAEGYAWPPLEFAEFTGSTTEPYTLNEKYIKNARVDAYVPVEVMQTWRAGEWHHIAVYWDDGRGPAPSDFLRIYVDGRKQSRAKPIGNEKNMFCRLNEPAKEIPSEGRYPRDQLQVGYIQRRIAQSNEGVFKHQNIVNPGGTKLSAPDTTKITLFACGVIDDFIAYDGEIGGGTLPDTIAVQPRFEPDATYVQHFDLSSRMPGGNRPLELAKISWNLLLPMTHGLNATPAQPGTNVGVIEITEPVSVKLRPAFPASAPQGPITFDKMQDASFGKLEVAGSDQPALLPPENPRLRYEVTLKAATFGPGAQSTPQMSQVDTPALHEVTVSYFLPTEETLLKERIID